MTEHQRCRVVRSEHLRKLQSLCLWRVKTRAEQQTGGMPVGCGRTVESQGDSRCLDTGEERPVRGSEREGSERRGERGERGVRVMQDQHTLLLQIFPRPEDPPGQAGRGPLACPTCKPFSPLCCQAESGWAVLASLVRTNINNVWNSGLVKTLTRVRYQVIISSVLTSGFRCLVNNVMSDQIISSHINYSI